MSKVSHRMYPVICRMRQQVHRAPAVRPRMLPVSALFRKCAAIATVALVLPACAMEGDLGRPKTYSVLGIPLDAAYWVDDSTHAFSQIVNPTTYAPTPAEAEMHETAYRLRVQPHNFIPLKVAYSPQTAYAGKLRYEQHTYGPSRMGNIDHELQADHQALSLFGAASRRVLAADRERMHALLVNQEFLTRGNKRNARNRMRRNCAFIEGTFTDLERRTGAYQYAVDRARIETPGPSPFAVEGSLNHLRDRAASLQYEVAQVCQEFDLGRHKPAHQPSPPMPSYKPAYSPSADARPPNPVK